MPPLPPQRIFADGAEMRFQSCFSPSPIDYSETILFRSHRHYTDLVSLVELVRNFRHLSKRAGVSYVEDIHAGPLGGGD